MDWFFFKFKLILEAVRARIRIVSFRGIVSLRRIVSWWRRIVSWWPRWLRGLTVIGLWISRRKRWCSVGRTRIIGISVLRIAGWRWISWGWCIVALHSLPILIITALTVIAVIIISWGAKMAIAPWIIITVSAVIARRVIMVTVLTLIGTLTIIVIIIIWRTVLHVIFIFGEDPQQELPFFVWLERGRHDAISSWRQFESTAHFPKIYEGRRSSNGSVVFKII